MRVRLNLELVGEVLAEDVYMKDNVIILTKGTTLTKKYIESLINKGFVYVYVEKS